MVEAGKDDEFFLGQAVARAREGIEAGQSPFGACIVRGGEILSCEHNVVWANTDITAHAEVTAIRRACQILGTIDLSGCTIYSTCEPCPMCFGAIHWARIERVVFGASIADAARIGFHELAIPNRTLVDLGGSSLRIEAGCGRAEAVAMMESWAARPTARSY